MKGGKSRLQRVKVLASGKYKFVKNLTKSKSRSVKTKTNPKKKGKVKTMAKKKRRSRKMTIPLAPIIGLIGTPAISSAIPSFMAGDFEGGIQRLGGLVGLWRDGSFHFDTLAANMTPVIAGLLIHKFVGGSPLNLNRMLASANVPFLRI